MLPILLLLFILVPIAELAAILQVGDWLGLWPTLAILVADSILGSLLMRTQGRAAWRRFTEATRAGRPPAQEVLDGVLIVVGGALLLTPGFLTDLFGLALLLPPTRAVVRRLLVRRLARRMVVAMTQGPPGSPFGSAAGPRPGAGSPFGPGPPFGSGAEPGARRAPARPADVEGTAHEVDPERLRP